MSKNLEFYKTNWQDTPEYHQQIHESFCENVNNVEWLKEHRDFVENHVFGFGERSFHWFWKILVDEMPSTFSFCEIGVFKAQVLSLIKMLASATGRQVTRYGVTPLDTSGGVWESDYKSDIEFIHNKFFVPKDYIILHGRSDNQEIIAQAQDKAPYDIVYIDGDHSRAGIDNDMLYYAPMAKRGGYLIIDDACCDMRMPFGFFQGITNVTDSVVEYMNGQGENWEFICNVVHLRVYKRK
jgi:hypothetical protein